ncbi:MAG TPA: CpXC domain-containing protein, partial [Promineifilum sp.]|nr:CpXC domain-containing protein [Promineifilum sp.]
MDHSLAQTISLQCPQCGARFTAAVWLIVDAGARPELLARVADGAVHTLVCPNGHDGEVDAPLLLYRPGETPALLFSPARRTTAEQDAEQAQGLIGRLRETLGGAWRDEWLGELSPLPREALAALARGDEAAAAEVMQAAVAAALPSGVARALADIAGLLAAEGVRVESAEDLERALAARPELRRRLEAALRAAGEGESDDEPAPPPPPPAAAPPPPAAAPPPPPPGPAPEEEELPPLLQALADFVNARTWLESYQFLLAHPELLSDELDALLGELLAEAAASGQEHDVRLWTEHRALLQRSRATGAAAAFAEKMEMTAEELDKAVQEAEDLAAIPPEARRAVEEIVAALAAEGVRP